ncbi:MAG: chemotaxis protein CheB [Clostridiales bacterium]|nr:chemotaxis protein CheB [Clostridiales bacterium]
MIELPYIPESFSGSVKKNDNCKVIAIAASTGGTDAIEEILKSLPKDIAPIVIVQHIKAGFTNVFAQHLDQVCNIQVKEAANGDMLKRGLALIAPADLHMKVNWRTGYLISECFVGKRIHGVMPAADILFNSVANTMGKMAIGIILTGMGVDGAVGIKQMRDKGAKTIGQNEETCVVYGMPKAAREMGGLDFVLPLKKIPDMILYLLNSESP